MANEVLKTLLIKLNTAGLNKKDPVLYDFLKSLVTSLQSVDSTVDVNNAAVAGSGFVTSTIGGTASVISMFTSIRNIEDVNAAAISAALDLL